MKLAKILTVVSLCLAVVAVTGCGKDAAYKKTTGTVTLEGQPLEGATIMFYPTASDGEAGAGRSDSAGKYEVTSSGASNGGTGLKPGDYKVTIVKYEEVVDEDQAAYDRGEITYDELQNRKSKGGPNKKSKAPKLLSPVEYSNTNATTLTATVTADPKANVFDFAL